MGSANFMEMQQRMQRELMSNPDTLRQVPYFASVYPFCILAINSWLCLGAWQPGDPELNEQSWRDQADAGVQSADAGGF